MLPSLRVMSPWELIWHRPKGIHWPTLSHGDKADHKRDEELWSRGSAADWWHCHLGPGFSSGPGKGKGVRQTPIFCVLRPYPGPLPLEETVTFQRPVTQTMAGNTPPSLSLHQEVGRKLRRLVPGDPPCCILASRTPRCSQG